MTRNTSAAQYRLTLQLWVARLKLSPCLFLGETSYELFSSRHSHAFESHLIETFRWNLLIFEKYLKLTIYLVEPIGSVSPKINTQDRLTLFDGKILTSINLLCPAQAYPTPVFRWGSFKVIVFVLSVDKFAKFFFRISLGCLQYLNIHNLLLITEPVGSVSPKKNTGDDIKVIAAAQGRNIGILCPAQAYPTPVFRYETCDNIWLVFECVSICLFWIALLVFKFFHWVDISYLLINIIRAYRFSESESSRRWQN